MEFKLPPLPYAYDALEPFYDQQTLRLHHTKHHAGYIDKLNEVLKLHPELAEHSVEALISSPFSIPENIREKVLQFGGGHANHSLFWRILSPHKNTAPSQPLEAALEEVFESFADFQKKFSESALSVFGSGWTWLSIAVDGKLEISNLPNQESPLNKGGKPILALDLWEHAYYLKFQNQRANWISAFWNIVDWEEVNKLYALANSGVSVDEIFTT